MVLSGKSKVPGLRIAITGVALLIAFSIISCVSSLYAINSSFTGIVPGLGQIPVQDFLNTSNTFLGWSYSAFLNELAISTAVGIVLPALLLAVLLLHMRMPKSRILSYAALPIAIISVLAILLVNGTLFNNATVGKTLLSTATGVALIPPGALGTSNYQSVAQTLGIVGYAITIVFVFGAALSITGAILYSGPSRRLTAATVLSVVIGLGILTVLSQAYVNASNNSAVSMLNSNIASIDGNVRYLLQNYSAYNNILVAKNNTLIYNSLLASSTPNQTLTSMFAEQLPITGNLGSGISSLSPQNLSMSDISSYDLGANNPLVNIFSKATLYALGVLPTYFLPVLNKLGQPMPTLYNLYVVLNTGNYIILTAVQLSGIFGCGMFSAPVAQPTVGGQGVTIYGLPQSLGATSFTSAQPSGYGSLFPDSAIGQGWLALLTQIGAMNQLAETGSYACMRGVQTNNTISYLPTNTTVSIGNLFYGLALNQNIGLALSEFYYNLNATQLSEGLSPAISYISYSNNNTIIDIGAINLTDPGTISLFVDGKQLSYTRYYNFLVAPGHLGIGNHNITINMTGLKLIQPTFRNQTIVQVPLTSLSLNGSVYVSPAILETPQLAGTALTFSLTSNNSLNITSVNVTDASGLMSFLYSDRVVGASLSGEATPKETYPYYTKTINVSLAEPCYFSAQYAYNITYETQYGEGRHLLLLKCT